MASPLDQFTVIKWADIEVAGYDISFTNSSAAMVSSVVLVSLLVALVMR